MAYQPQRFKKWCDLTHVVLTFFWLLLLEFDLILALQGLFSRNG